MAQRLAESDMPAEGRSNQQLLKSACGLLKLARCEMERASTLNVADEASFPPLSQH